MKPGTIPFYKPPTNNIPEQAVLTRILGPYTTAYASSNPDGARNRAINNCEVQRKRVHIQCPLNGIFISEGIKLVNEDIKSFLYGTSGFNVKTVLEYSCLETYKCLTYSN